MDDLAEKLQDQVAFLDDSCDAYDQGRHREAYRLATTVRVLVHDTAKSHSLLAQLGVKDTIQYLDARAPGFDHLPPIAPGALSSAPGLAVVAHFYSPEGNSRDAAEYWPAFRQDDLPLASKPLVPFDTWWSKPVSTDTRGTRQFRRHFILAGANKDGGAHIDTTFGGEYQGYRAMTRDGTMGLVAKGSIVVSGSDPTVPLPNGMSPALAIIRHIAEEIRVGLRLQVPELLGEMAATPPTIELEQPFMFTGDQQTSLGPGFSLELGPHPIVD